MGSLRSVHGRLTGAIEDTARFVTDAGLPDGVWPDDLVTWVGGMWGDQRDFYVCKKCEWETILWDVEACENCGGELLAHLPREELWTVRYRAWKSKRRWLPQRYWVYPGGQSREKPYSYWQWMGREWRKRPAKEWDWIGGD